MRITLLLFVLLTWALTFPALVEADSPMPLAGSGTGISSVQFDQGHIILRWDVRADRKYAVECGPTLPPDDSWTQIEDLTPPWLYHLSDSEACYFFRLVSTFNPPHIVINEIMYNPPSDPDQKGEFVELYNYGDVPIDLSGYTFHDSEHVYTFRAGEIVHPNQYLLIARDLKYIVTKYGNITVRGPFDGKLDNGGERLELWDHEGNVVDSVKYNDDPPWDTRADGLGGSLELIDPARHNDIHDNWHVSLPLGLGGTPGAPNSVFDQETPPFMYLHTRNPDEPTSSDAVNVQIKVTDNDSVASVVLKYNEGLGEQSVSMFDDGQHGDLAAGDSVYGALIGPFPDQSLVSYTIEARDNLGQLSTHPENAPDEVKTAYVNNGYLTDRLVKINEIMYHPPKDASGLESEEFVELFNSSASPVAITGWRLSSGIDYTFPERVLAPGEYAIVCLNKNALAAAYGLSEEDLFGDYTGRLANGGEKINLRNRNDVLLESVEYDDLFPWAVAADGYGYSLERIDLSGDPPSPRTWGAAPPPGESPTEAVWQFFQTVGTPTTTRLYFYLMNTGECLIDDIELMPVDGGENTISNPGFEEGTASWQRAGTQDFTIESQACPGSSGTSCLKIISTGAGSGSGNSVYQDGLPVNSSTRYRLTFWAKWSSGTSQLTTRFSGAPSASDPLMATFDLSPSSLTNPFSFASPGRTNHLIQSPAPPIVTDIVRSPSRPQETEQVRIEATITPCPEISSVSLEMTVDDQNTTLPMYDDGVSGGDAEAGDGVYTATLPPQFPYAIVGYRIHIGGQDGDLGCSPRIQAPAQTYAYYIEGELDKVSTPNPIYHLYIKPSDLSLIASYARLQDPAHPNWNATVPGTFIYNGEVFDVQVRHRGSRWCRPQGNGKMSFKIKFPRYHQFDGWPDINLNSADHYGFTGYEESVAFEMFRQVGLAAPLTNFARFNINGNYHGFYFQIESPGEEFLESHLGEEGDLFKSMGDPLGRFPYDWGDWRPLSSLQKYEDVYQRKSRRYDSHEIVRDVIQGMRQAYDTSPQTLQAFLEKHFDMDKTLSYVATAAWIGVWDEAFHNFFAYRDTGGKWMVFPWDTDGCFAANGASRSTNSIFVGEHDNPDNRSGWSNELKHYIFSVPELRKQYVLHLQRLNNLYFTPTKLKAYLDRLVYYVGTDADEDPFGWGRTPEAEYDDVLLFIEARYDNIREQIQKEKEKPYFQ